MKYEEQAAFFIFIGALGGREGERSSREGKKDWGFPYPSNEFVSSPILNIGRHILLKGPQAPATEVKQKYA